MIPQARTDTLGLLRIKSPLNKGANSQRGIRYPKDFKDLVLTALKQGISPQDIIAETGLKFGTIYLWRKNHKVTKPGYRRLRVVDSEPTSIRETDKVTVKIGRRASLELNPGDLTAELLSRLADL